VTHNFTNLAGTISEAQHSNLTHYTSSLNGTISQLSGTITAAQHGALSNVSHPTLAQTSLTIDATNPTTGFNADIYLKSDLGDPSPAGTMTTKISGIGKGLALYAGGNLSLYTNWNMAGSLGGYERFRISETGQHVFYGNSAEYQMPLSTTGASGTISASQSLTVGTYGTFGTYVTINSSTALTVANHSSLLTHDFTNLSGTLSVAQHSNITHTFTNISGAISEAQHSNLTHYTSSLNGTISQLSGAISATQHGSLGAGALHTVAQPIQVSSAGSSVGTRSILNFVSGASVADNGTTSSIDVTISGASGVSAYTGGTMTGLGTLVGTRSKLNFPYGFQVSDVAATTALHIEGHMALLYTAAGSGATTMVFSGLSAFSDFRHLRFVANTHCSTNGSATLTMNGDTSSLYQWQHNGSASNLAVIAQAGALGTSASVRQFTTDSLSRTQMDLTLYYFRSTAFEKKLLGEVSSLYLSTMLRHAIYYKNTSVINYVTFTAPASGTWDTSGSWQIYGIF